MNTILDALGGRYRVPAVGGTSLPRPGDVWVVTIDGRDIASVLTVAVRETYVLAWPVTAVNDQVFWPAFPANVGAETLLVWPHCEFGMATAALGRKIAAPLEERTVRDIRWALAEREPMPVPAQPPRPDGGPTGALVAVCDQTWAVGDWSWPSAAAGEGVFNTEALEDAGIDARRLGQILSIQPGRASRLATGEEVPGSEEVSAALAYFPQDTTADDVLAADSGPDVDALVQPRFKKQVTSLAELRELSETATRTLVLRTARRAARQTPGLNPQEAAEARVRHALSDLLNDDE